uniref:Uncharacterized protein n=1 Tax=viral metagenome TaxID=1070528 RepID=A0A6M3KGQ6_9ZZZZ
MPVKKKEEIVVKKPVVEKEPTLSAKKIIVPEGQKPKEAQKISE